MQKNLYSIRTTWQTPCMISAAFLLVVIGFDLNSNGLAAQQESQVQEQLQQALQAEQSGDLASAERAYRAVLRLKPDFPEIHGKLGFLYQLQGKFQQAAESFEEGLKLNPALPEAHFLLGVTYYQLYQYEKAVGFLNQAIAADPENSKAHLYLGSLTWPWQKWIGP